MTRLSFTKGGASKFWEAKTRGSELHIRFGKIGSQGQTQIKQFGTADAAELMAVTLTAKKQKEGYVADTGAPAKVPTTGPAAAIVVKDVIGTIGAAWQIGSEVWFAEVDAGDLKGKQTLAEAIAKEPRIECWRFGSDAAARTAIAYVVKHAAKKHTLKIDTSASRATWLPQLGKAQQRIARFGAGGSPAVTATRDQTHPWLHARVPATSYLSGRLMVPVWSLVGAIDARFGKRTGIYASTCPQQLLDPHIEGVWEVVVQDAASTSVDAYFTGPGGTFATVHLSQQNSSLGGPSHWAVVEHSGDKSTIGWYRTQHVASLAAANKLFAERSVQHGMKRVPALGPWYAKILDDITRHNRVPGQKPASVKLGVHHDVMMQSVSKDAYGAPSSTVLGTNVVAIGGAPEFCQEDWDYLPANPWSKAPLVPIASFGSGDAPLWSEVVNDGDAGTFNVWAAPGVPFGLTTFSCH